MPDILDVKFTVKVVGLVLRVDDHRGGAGLFESLIPMGARGHALHGASVKAAARTARPFIIVEIDPFVPKVSRCAPAPAGASCAYAPITRYSVCHIALMFIIYTIPEGNSFNPQVLSVSR